MNNKVPKNILTEEECTDIESIRKYNKQQELMSSTSYKLTKAISIAMDKYFLDPIIGLIPGLGDILPSMFALPSIYVSLFKVKSIPLTLAVIFNILKDCLFGMIPLWIGNIIDFVNRSYKQNIRLIVGFVEEDIDVIEEVNKKAIWTVILILIIIGLIILMIKFVQSTIEWFSELF